MKKVQKEGKEDELLILFVAILTLAGLFFLYSTGTYNGKVKFGDAGYYLKKQLFASVLGMIAFWVMARIDYHRVAAFATVLYLCSIALSTAVLFVGRSYNGSKRWLALGPLSFQPAEFAKAAVILFLSVRISNRKKKTDSPWFMLRTMAALLPIVGLVGTNNLSTAIIILGIGVILIFVAHPRYLPFLGIGAAGIGFVAIFLSMESYRLERLAIWRDPEKYEKGFQTIQGLYAIGSGGIFGRGMGNSLQKLGFVPEAQNGNRTVWSYTGYPSVWRPDLETHGGSGSGRGSAGRTDRRRNHGPYCTPGNPEYCCCYKYDSQYRDYIAVYQLWRNICIVFDGRDGACIVSHQIFPCCIE